MGVQLDGDHAFVTSTDQAGQYAITLPAGSYDVNVTAWGYYSTTLYHQAVFTNILSVADITLSPLDKVSLTGFVLSGTRYISNALVYVADSPSVKSTTSSDGAYSLSLPPGTHKIIVEKANYRRLEKTITIGNSDSAHLLFLAAAPKILLVNADSYSGWFYGWPVHNFFQWSLDKENYQYDVWSIQYLHFQDTAIMPDNSIGYGIPSTTTLKAYDLVIWAHVNSSPESLSVDDELITYMDNGGRLILSGMNVSWGTSNYFFDKYLHATFVGAFGAAEGESISGSDFLDGYTLKLSNASLYDYANGSHRLMPGIVAPADGAAYPVLNYDNGNGAAALAIDSCTSPYRAVYFALGYENIGPRGDDPDPAIAEVLDKSIDWAMGTKATYGVKLVAIPSSLIGQPSDIITYTLQVVNSGATTGTFQVNLGDSIWPTNIFSGTNNITQTIELAPCDSQNLKVSVKIPNTAKAGDGDQVTITVIHNGNTSTTDKVELNTITFPTWQVEAPMPTGRYRMSSATLANAPHFYVIGGWLASGVATDANERYNACINQWETMTSLPEPLANFGAATLNEKIYVVGGSNDAIEPHDTLYVYHPLSDTWTTAANLPKPLRGHAVATANGKLYAFGGYENNLYLDSTFIYDPDTDTWAEGTPMPAGRIYADATTLNNKIYVVGGWPNLKTVEVYDPATDTWSSAASLITGRQSAGLATGEDGYIYVSGGGDRWNGLTQAERYRPSNDAWEATPPLIDWRRAGAESAYAAGRIFTVGGTSFDVININESFLISDDFCLSEKSTLQETIQPGQSITYTIEIHSDFNPITATVFDPIPSGTTFTGFTFNPIGATYNTVKNQIEWQGTLLTETKALTLSFRTRVQISGWHYGDLIKNTATFTDNTGAIFSKTIITTLDFPDFSVSTKTVNKQFALAGEMLTYTLHIENASIVSDTATLRDLIPANSNYVTGSLSYTVGSAGYDPESNVIAWTGSLPGKNVHANTSENYQWGDSDGNGLIQNVTFEWTDISTTGIPLDLIFGTSAIIPIGFDFSFYDNTYPLSTPVLGELGVSPNGYLSFEPNYRPNPDLYDWGEDCPIISRNDPNDTIAPYWGYLDTSTGNVYYQLLGTAPNRRLVVQWDNVKVWYTQQLATFQAILYEQSNIIKFQYLSLSTSWSYVIGIENQAGTKGVTYNQCYQQNVVYDKRAITFLPPGAKLGEYQVDLTFAVTSNNILSVNTWLTNTATVADSYNTSTQSAGTLLNPVILDQSNMFSNKTQASQEEKIGYTLTLINTGLVSANGASIINKHAPDMTYDPQSLTCSAGICIYNTDTLTWRGDISPSQTITITFEARLETPLPNMTPVSNTAYLNNGYGDIYKLESSFLIYSSDMSDSFIKVSPTQAKTNDIVVYTIYIYNSASARSKAIMQNKLPPSLIYQADSLTCGSGLCTYQNGTISWEGLVEARNAVPVSFQAQVSTNADIGTLISNTVTVTDTAWGVGYPLTATISLNRAADLWVNKQGPGVIAPNTSLSYIISYGNAGPHQADTPAQVLDVLPEDTTYVSSNPPGVYNPTANTVVWDVGTFNILTGTMGTSFLELPISHTLMLTVNIPPDISPLPKILTNTVTISPILSDPNILNNEARLLTVVGSTVNLLNSEKTVSPQKATQGDTLTYTITLKNTGVVAASTIITDPLPTGVTYISGSAQINGNLSNLYQSEANQISWQGLIPANNLVTLQFQVEITTPTGTNLMNTVLVDDNTWLTFKRQAMAEISQVPIPMYPVYLPIVLK